MSRYRRSYYNYARTEWRAWHESGRAAIERNFGGIDKDVTQAFFNLSSRDLARVLNLYEQKYGNGAARYAGKTIRKWQRGRIQMSGQTLERLLEVVPYVLSFDTKLALYRKLRDAHRRKEHVAIAVTSAADIQLVEATVGRIVDRSKAIPLPPIVDQRLVWLAQDDGVTLRQLVAASEEAEGAAISEALRTELVELHRLFQGLERTHGLQHVVTLPCGTVTIDFARPKKKRRWFMSEDQQTPSQQQTNLPARTEGQRLPQDIFEFALQSMISPDDSQEVILAAQREYLRLQAKKVEGEMDSLTAERELRQFIDQMREANSLQNVSMHVDADFKRASGTTRMTVKKSRKWWPF